MRKTQEILYCDKCEEKQTRLYSTWYYTGNRVPIEGTDTLVPERVYSEHCIGCLVLMANQTLQAEFDKGDKQA